MRNFRIPIVLGFLSACASGGAPSPGRCTALRFDLTNGTLSGLAPTASTAEIKRRLPCFTGESPEGVERLNGGGGVFFLNHQMYFYTHRDWIEVRAGFAGRLSPDLLNASGADIERALGPAERSLPKSNSLLFPAQYGCIQVYRDPEERVSRIAAHARHCEAVIDEASSPVA